MSNPANTAWYVLLDRVMSKGDEVAPRGLPTREILGHKTELDMRFPVITNTARGMGYKFMCAEAAWILSGDNRVETIAPYSKAISNFSDDGVFFFGAYGPRIRDQLRHVIQALATDADTRQAVLSIWRPNPPVTKDVPCTLTAQFTLRNDRIDCFVNMRSSDAWLGVPYDWFNFTMLTGVAALLLTKRTGVTYRMGTLHFYAASQHLYATNYPKVAKSLEGTYAHDFARPPEFNPYEFADHEELIHHLWCLARGEYDMTEGTFLVEELRSHKKVAP